MLRLSGMSAALFHFFTHHCNTPNRDVVRNDLFFENRSLREILPNADGRNWPKAIAQPSGRASWNSCRQRVCKKHKHPV
jgi:hypothetical protein